MTETTSTVDAISENTDIAGDTPAVPPHRVYRLRHHLKAHGRLVDNRPSPYRATVDVPEGSVGLHDLTTLEDRIGRPLDALEEHVLNDWIAAGRPYRWTAPRPATRPAVPHTLRARLTASSELVPDQAAPEGYSIGGGYLTDDDLDAAETAVGRPLIADERPLLEKWLRDGRPDRIDAPDRPEYALWIGDHPTSRGA